MQGFFILQLTNLILFRVDIVNRVVIVWEVHVEVRLNANRVVFVSSLKIIVSIVFFID